MEPCVMMCGPGHPVPFAGIDSLSIRRPYSDFSKYRRRPKEGQIYSKGWCAHIIIVLRKKKKKKKEYNIAVV